MKMLTRQFNAKDGETVPLRFRREARLTLPMFALVFRRFVVLTNRKKQAKDRTRLEFFDTSSLESLAEPSSTNSLGLMSTVVDRRMDPNRDWKAFNLESAFSKLTPEQQFCIRLFYGYHDATALDAHTIVRIAEQVCHPKVREIGRRAKQIVRSPSRKLNLSHSEIGQLLDIAPSTVKSRLRVAEQVLITLAA
jgi:hypothetical protein